MQLQGIELSFEVSNVIDPMVQTINGIISLIDAINGATV